MDGPHPKALSLASYSPSPRQSIVAPIRKAVGAGLVSLTWLGMVGGGGQKYGLLNRGSAILQEGRAPVTIRYEISLPFETQIPQPSRPPTKPRDPHSQAEKSGIQCLPGWTSRGKGHIQTRVLPVLGWGRGWTCCQASFHPLGFRANPAAFYIEPSPTQRQPGEPREHLC